MTATNSEKHKNINRGIYLVINIGKSFYDKKNNPEYLTVPSGAVKFGKSLDLLGINNRYKSLAI
jgi:CRISPR/Cas system CMR-associated protein Cmr3 (group 5 of RAMP superfamily)